MRSRGRCRGLALLGVALVVAVLPRPAGALRNVSERLLFTPGAGPVMVAGLRPAPGRASSAPLLVVGGDRVGLPTSDSTRRRGLVAFEDVRPTLAGGRSDGDDGTPIRVVANSGPAGAATWLDRRVGALVVARTLAIPLLALAAVLALLALLGAWRARRRGSEPAGWDRAALALLALTLALPAGYLAASVAEPLAARALRGGFRAAGLAVVDGLPRLGADVGGALTAMLTAAAALVVLAPSRPRLGRVLLLAGLALVAAVAGALGGGIGGPVTHAGRF